MTSYFSKTKSSENFIATPSSGHAPPIDSDLFSFLSHMHLTNGASAPASAPAASRKRKMEKKLAQVAAQQQQQNRRNYMRKGGGEQSDDEDVGLNTPQHVQEQHVFTDSDLAANFEDSFCGLGSVDANSTNVYNISEALMALPNLSISNLFRSEGEQRPKDEPLSRENSTEEVQCYGALDLSNDEVARMADQRISKTCLSEKSESPKTTFTGSVSKEKSPVYPSQMQYAQHYYQDYPNLDGENGHSDNASVNYNNVGSERGESVERKISTGSLNRSAGSGIATNVERDRGYDRQVFGSSEDVTFQHVLGAATSLATKVNEPTITYLNQGQSYELRLKKLGDLSNVTQSVLKCTVRICFHERRLQYMENEQVAEWSKSHPRERILNIDMPLSYGIWELNEDASQINVASFKWDPTRDTSVFIKVNCISTEFTLKKHGGERGVPFRLQVETFQEDVRLHAAGCILQVFKLKGADRKHKQDRDKVIKRSDEEKQMYAPQYNFTVLSELSVDSIYVPPTSRPASPPDSPRSNSALGSNLQLANRNSLSSSLGKDEFPTEINSANNVNTTPLSIPVSLTNEASPEVVTAWLGRNRYGQYMPTFRNFSGRDMMRLMREEVISLCGPSDGIRLFNDLHTVPVIPKTTFYVAQKNTHEYNALFLEELTVREFLNRLATAIGLQSPAVFNKVFLIGPRNIFVRMTDHIVQYTKPETIFYYTFKTQESSDSCDVILENAMESNQDFERSRNNSQESQYN